MTGSIMMWQPHEASSAQASQIIIPELIAAGYELVTVSEMAAARGGMVPGQVYNYFDPALGQTQESTEIQPETNTSAETQVQQSEVETQAPTSGQSQSENQTEGSQTAESAPDTMTENTAAEDTDTTSSTNSSHQKALPLQQAVPLMTASRLSFRGK